jgi:hypothetical protein
MMRRATILVAALAVVLFAGSLSKPAIADVSFSFFYSNLSPYGSWEVAADYGRVWRPYDYEPGWNPYYDGHWVYSDYGWTWVSDYAWGAIPYHYGTWTLDPYLGWIWVPGYVWAPSWVVFSSGPDYIGWAPVPPRFVVGASIGSNSFAPDHYVVMPARAFLAPRVRTYAVPRSSARVALEKTRIVNNITVQNHIVVNHGPDPRGIERASGSPIRPVSISRVKHAMPGGRFDVEQVRADRHDRGSAPRATLPEPVRGAPAERRPEQARGPETPRPSAPARQPGPARAPEAIRSPVSSGPRATPRPPAAPRDPGHDSRPSERHAQPGQPRAQPGEPHGQQAAQPAKPPASAKPGRPAKPPQKPPPGKHGGAGG